MKNIIEYFKSNIFSIFTAIFLYSILSIIFFLEYRFEIYMLLKRFYPELDKFSFFNYMGISFHFESKIILIFLSNPWFYTLTSQFFRQNKLTMHWVIYDIFFGNRPPCLADRFESPILKHIYLPGYSLHF